MAMISAAGLEMFYKWHGEAGEPLVVIAGLGGHSGSFAPQIPAFAERLRVLRFDNRGAGRTSAPDEPYSMRQMAGDTAALMEALGVESAHVLGVSMGGMIAQELAISHPRRVRKLVLACTRARPTGARQMAAEAQRVLRMAELGPREREAYGMPWGRTAAFMQDQARVDAAIDLAGRDPYPMQPHAYIRQLEATMAHDTLDGLGQIEAETLVLVGAEDILTPPWESAALAAAIPNATMRVLPRGGHGFSAEYADEFNAAVIEFLR
jgi:pimeloyl-ACP methyl ester carboxylesterase